MNALRTLSLACSAAAIFCMVGCTDDFAPHPDRARPVGAVQSPTELNSASGEMLSEAAPATPIASVDFPNKGEQPKFHTILDPLFKPPTPPVGPPPSATPTTPAITQPAHHTPDAITGQ